MLDSLLSPLFSFPLLVCAGGLGRTHPALLPPCNVPATIGGLPRWATLLAGLWTAPAPFRTNTRVIAARCCVAGCAPIDGYSVEADLNGGAGGLRLASSFATAATECNADPACAGFNNYGWLLPALAPKQAAQGICLYTRLPTSESCGCAG